MAGGGRSWLAPLPLVSITETKEGFHVGELYVARSQISSPEGELWPAQYQYRLHTLLDVWHSLCVLAGEEFPIRSGYRSLPWQDEYPQPCDGGHDRGRSLDLTVPPHWTSQRMAALAIRVRRYSRLSYIAVYPEHLHLDIRPCRCPTMYISRARKARRSI